MQLLGAQPPDWYLPESGRDGGQSNDRAIASKLNWMVQRAVGRIIIPD
jgi:hypothetical protein